MTQTDKVHIEEVASANREAAWAILTLFSPSNPTKLCTEIAEILEELAAEKRVRAVLIWCEDEPAMRTLQDAEIAPAILERIQNCDLPLLLAIEQECSAMMVELAKVSDHIFVGNHVNFAAVGAGDTWRERVERTQNPLYSAGECAASLSYAQPIEKTSQWANIACDKRAPFL